jgi:hypothetical protein
MKARLQELINKDNMEYYLNELQEEFADFENDLILLNQLLIKIVLCLTPKLKNCWKIEILVFWG